MGDRPSDPADVGGRAARGPKRAVPGAAQAGAAGLDRGRMEAFGEPPAGKVLRPDTRWPKGAQQGSRAVGTSLGGDLPDRERCVMRWLAKLRLRLRSLFLRSRVEQELHEELR